MAKTEQVRFNTTELSTACAAAATATSAPVRSAAAFIKTAEGRTVFEAGLERVAHFITKNKLDDDGDRMGDAIWSSRGEVGPGRFMIQEQIEGALTNVDRYVVKVQGNQLRVFRSDIMHYGSGAWKKAVSVDSPVTAESLQRALESAILDRSDRAPLSRQEKLEVWR